MFVVQCYTTSTAKKGKSSNMLDEAVASEAQIKRDFQQLCLWSDPLLTVQLFLGISSRSRRTVAAIPAATTRSACTNLSPTRVAS